MLRRNDINRGVRRGREGDSGIRKSILYQHLALLQAVHVQAKWARMGRKKRCDSDKMEGREDRLTVT